MSMNILYDFKEIQEAHDSLLVCFAMSGIINVLSTIMILFMLIHIVRQHKLGVVCNNGDVE